MSFIFSDAWLITMNGKREVLEEASVCVEKDRIAGVGTRQALQRRFPTAEIVDCKGRIVMPGMVNTHTHLFQTLLKGLGDDMVLIFFSSRRRHTRSLCDWSSDVCSSD